MQFHSRNPHSLEMNLTYCTCYVTVRSRLTCFGTLDVIFKSTSASVDRPLHENRIIEAVADNTIRFQPEEVLAFGCDVSCLSERQSRPASGRLAACEANSGDCCWHDEVRLQKENCPCFIPSHPAYCVDGISSNRLSPKIYFFPCSSRWALTASSACPLP